jgi:hypothetical protein
MSENCDEKITGLCAVQVNIKSSHLITVCTYKSNSGNFDKFVTLLDRTVKHLYRPRTDFLICGDINVTYLMELSHTKKTVFIIHYLYFV